MTQEINDKILYHTWMYLWSNKKAIFFFFKVERGNKIGEDDATQKEIRVF